MAMPAQLNQIAKAMGITSNQLGEGLREGAISMDDFINTITRLNTKGVGEFASFEQQARGATGGIQTSITNLKTAITRGVANIINSFNDMLKKNNLPTLQEMIKIASAKISEAFTKMSKTIQGLNLKPVISLIKGLYNAFQILKPILPVIIASLVGYKLALLGIKAVNIVMGIMSFAKAFLTLIPAINGVRSAITLLNVAFSLNPIGIIIALIAGLVAIFVVLWKKCDWFRNFWIGLWEGIKTVISTVINWIKENWKSLLLIMVNPFVGAFNLLYQKCSWFRNFVNKFVNGVKSLIRNAFNYVISIPSRIIEKWKNLIKGIKNIGSNLISGLWQGMKNKASWLYDKITGFGKGILNKVKGIFGVHSPSRKFAWIGEMNMVGLDEGMQNMKNKVMGTLNGIFTDMVDFSPNVNGSMSNNFSPSVNVVNNISMEQDPLGQMVRKVKTFSGGAKNDFNYGMGV